MLNLNKRTRILHGSHSEYVIYYNEIYKRGNLGGVYLGYDLRNEQYVIIKTKLCQNLLEKEYHIITKLASTRYVPEVLDFFTIDGISFLVLKKVNGKHLGEFNKCKSFPPNIALEFIRNILTAMISLHRLTYIHTDIHPQNILWNEQIGPESLKILDFEFSQKINDNGSWIGEVYWGRLEFIPPEMFWNPVVLDFRTDIYMIGALLYYLLKGEPPFIISQNFIDYDSMKLEYYKKRAKKMDLTNLPPQIKSIIIRSLAFEPRNRYCDAKEMLDDILRAMEK